MEKPNIRKKHTSRTNYKLKKNLFWILVILPCVCLLLVMNIYPLIYSLTLAFHKWEISMPVPPSFIGFGNFKKAINDPRFISSLGRTAIVIGIGLTLEFGIALIIAILLYQQIKGINIIRSLMILPMVTIPVVVGYIWKMLFHYSAGPANHLLSIIGLPAVKWLATSRNALFSVIITDIWQWTPFVSLVLLTGLIALPQEPLEAAKADGASGWQIFSRITLPMLRPVITVAILIRLIEMFKLFDKIYVLTEGGPGTATELINIFIYYTSFRYFSMGYGCAISYILLIIIIIITTIFIRVLEREMY